MPSSVIAGIFYDSEKLILRIVYVSGSIYEYLNVPGDVYDQFKTSFSKGTFLNNNIKGNYSYNRIK